MNKNKVFLSLLLSVCVLGMALILLNERLSSETLPISTHAAGMQTQPVQVAVAASTPVEVGEELRVPVQMQAAVLDTPVHTQPREVVPTEPVVTPKPLPEKTVAHLRPIAKTEEVIRRSEQAPEVQPAKPVVAEKKKELAHETAQGKGKKEEAALQKKEAIEAKPKQEAKKEAAALKEFKIKKLVVFAREKGATVRMHGSSALKYKTMQMHNPERLLVELDGEWQVVAPGVPKNPLVSNVRLGKQPRKTRVVIDLKTEPKRCKVLLGKDQQTLDVRVDL